MNPLVHHIRREDQIVGRAPLPEHRAVVANPGHHAVPRGDPQPPQLRLYPVNQQCFGQANIVG